ncbi:MAG: hypothetical protein BroJett024_44020 [Alphaproteobacteria bacterium]|nr:MAG: hypothetical protein BroJett024_44020 [Alphaproteobacteria bacterium]
MNAVVFGGFALLALSRLASLTVSARTVGHVAALLLIALLGYRYASCGSLSRAWGIVAFVAAWSWTPVVPLVALWSFGALRARQNSVMATKQRQEDEPAQAGAVPPDLTDFSNAHLTLKLAAEDYAGQVRAFHTPFASVYGDGVVPLLVEHEGRVRAVYVEGGPWNWPAKERCYRWLAGLRTSEREDLEVEIRSADPVPEVVSYYTGNTPRVVFELAGFVNFAWVNVADFAERNVATLRRIAHEYLDLEIGEGQAALESLDRIVVDALRPGGQVLPSTIILLGSLFGQMLITQYGGRWLVQGDDMDAVMVEVSSPAGTVKAYVFNKIIKLFNNGMEDSAAFMARSLGDRLRGAGAQG